MQYPSNDFKQRKTEKSCSANFLKDDSCVSFSFYPVGPENLRMALAGNDTPPVP